ncbi:MAG: tRNA (adenine-N1)-methyltransferase, partial [Acidimicrobiales bacterium]|nr:tRNA (adenine-N1)-methyltransferase [Acidimicrobiales bacterium]
MSRAFEAGERVLLFDSKGRRYLVTLSSGGEFHTHSGPVGHDQLIGAPEGVRVRSTRGAGYVAVRPTLAEVVLKMPRGAQVIYPKDLGPILIMADVFPGARVFESGLGSGALSMALLRAGADITGYELRPDFAARAAVNVAGFLGAGALDRYDVHVRDAYEGIEESDFDRIVLDLPEPWRLVKA